MGKKEVIDKIKRYADLVRNELQVRMILLQNLYPGEVERMDGQWDVVVVVDRLQEDQDYIEIKEKLFLLAQEIDTRIDPELIESEKGDYTGFFAEIKKTGDIIYQNKNGDCVPFT